MTLEDRILGVDNLDIEALEQTIEADAPLMRLTFGCTKKSQIRILLHGCMFVVGMPFLVMKLLIGEIISEMRYQKFINNYESEVEE